VNLKRVCLGVTAIFAASLLYFFIPSGSRKRVVILGFSGIEIYERMMIQCVERAEALGLKAEVMAAAASGDKILVDQVCSVALQNGADCFITIGRALTQTLFNNARRRGVRVPIVFTNVSEPIALGVINDFEVPGSLATGVVPLSCAVSVPARLLMLIMPQLSSVFIPYYAVQVTPQVEVQKDAFERYFTSHGIKVRAVGFDSLADIVKHVELSLGGEDAILTLVSDQINDWHAPGMVSLTRRRGIRRPRC